MFLSLRVTRQLLLFAVALGGLSFAGGCNRETAEMDLGEDRADAPLGGLESSREASHPLVGQAAPSFTLDRLDGSQAELEQHRGDVVLLDFWATWCPPCVEGLPKVSRVASELENEGVVFYAVNVGEDAETVENFLAQQGFNVPVLMDRDRAVSEDYQANAIPQTVVIGKEGTVQAVHVGLSGNMESTLRQQLESLLSEG